MSRMTLGSVWWSIALSVALAGVAHADGTFVWRTEHRDIREPEQKAVLLFDRGTEDLVLEVRYSGAVEDFGWIVPLPSVPRVRADEPELFAALSRFTQDTPVHRSSRGMERTMSSATVSGVDVLGRMDVGVYDVAILSARSGEGLRGWLRKNDFRVPGASARILDEYAARGWVFAALRVRLAAQAGASTALREGTLQPVRFRFATPEPVFPLRISALGGGRTTVLLYVCAARPLVHRTCDRAAWDERVGWSWPAYIPWLDPDSTFRALSRGAGQVTKLRAELSPAQMEDVYFRELKPAFGAASAIPRERLESIALLRAFAPEGAAAVLARMLERPSATRAESLAACEALGGLSDTTGMGALVRAAHRGSPQVRNEAADALARRRCPEALPLLARACREWAAGFGYEHSYAMEHLIAWGHPGALPLLEGWSRGDSDPSVTLVRPVLGGAFPEHDFLALRAATGDEIAIDRIVADILAQSGRTSAAEVQAYARRVRGSWDGRPNELGLPILLEFDSSPTDLWPALHMWHELLKANPRRHDEVLRRAASAPGVPVLGRATLLGFLERPTAAEAESVLVMATRSLRDRRSEDRIVASVQFDTGIMRDVDYPVPVTVAALALKRMRAGPQLSALWNACADEDTDTRGEVAAALAESGAEHALEGVLDYVARDWDACSRTARYREGFWYVGDSVGVRMPGLQDLDVGYRRRAILHLLQVGVVRDSVVERLTLGQDLSPLHRMFWMKQFAADPPFLAGGRARVLAELDRIEGSGAADSLERRVAGGVRASILEGEEIRRKYGGAATTEWR